MMRDLRLIWIFVSILLLSSAASAYEIIGDSVFYDSQYANLTVTPHTVINPSRNHQEFNICAKASPGALCIAYVFDNALQEGTAEYWTAYDHPYTYCYTDTDCTTKYSNYKDWMNVNSAFSTVSYQNKQIYYTTSPLNFQAHECQTWRIQYKPQEDEGKWNLWTWNSQTGDCAADYLNGNYNFFYDMDPWWSTSDNNVTQGHTYLSNDHFSDNFESYDLTPVFHLDTIEFQGYTSSISTSTNRMEGTHSNRCYNPIRYHSSCQNTTINKEITSDRLVIWYKGNNASAEHLIAIITTSGTISARRSNIKWEKIEFDLSTKIGEYITTIKIYPDPDFVNCSKEVLFDNIYFYNTSNYFNVNRWLNKTGEIELQKANNLYGHNTTIIKSVSDTHNHMYYYLNTTPFKDVEIIAKSKNSVANSFSGIILSNDTNTNSYPTLSGYRYIFKSTANTDSYLRRSISGALTELSTSDTDAFSINTWYWVKLVRYGSNGTINAYTSEDGSTWTLRENAVDTTFSNYYIGFFFELKNNIYDNILVREIIPNTYYSPHNITPSFIYDDSEEDTWTDAVIEWQKSNNKDLSSYSTIHTDTYPNPSDQTDFTRELSGGIWRANVSVCDASACVSNYTQTITIYNDSTTVTATDAVSTTIIQSFSAHNNQTGETFTTTTSPLILYSIDDTQIEYSSNGYENKNQTPTDVILNPWVNFTLLKETDNTAFNVSETPSTKMHIYCTNDTIEHTFTDNSETIAVSCPWELIKIDAVYNTSSYYRTLIPARTDRDINFYMLNLLDDISLQIILILNDLTGEFSEGSAIIRKYIGGETRDIIEQEFDVEDKVVLYLLQNAIYTLVMKTSAGEERNLGNFIADIAEEKTITTPPIEFYPTATLHTVISWQWSFNISPLKLQYNDTSTTDTITFTVWNASNTSHVLYTTTSTDVSFITFSYPTAANVSYIACFNAMTSEGEVYDCRGYWQESSVTEWSGFDAETQKNWKMGISVFFLVFIFFIFGSGHQTICLAMISLFMWVFINWRWLDFGSAYTNYAILSISVVITILTFYMEGDRQ